MGDSEVDEAFNCLQAADGAEVAAQGAICVEATRERQRLAQVAKSEKAKPGAQ